MPSGGRGPEQIAREDRNSGPLVFQRAVHRALIHAPRIPRNDGNVLCGSTPPQVPREVQVVRSRVPRPDDGQARLSQQRRIAASEEHGRGPVLEARLQALGIPGIRPRERPQPRTLPAFQRDAKGRTPGKQGLEPFPGYPGGLARPVVAGRPAAKDAFRFFAQERLGRQFLIPQPTHQRRPLTAGEWFETGRIGPAKRDGQQHDRVRPVS